MSHAEAIDVNDNQAWHDATWIGSGWRREESECCITYLTWFKWYERGDETGSVDGSWPFENCFKGVMSIVWVGGGLQTRVHERQCDELSYREGCASKIFVQDISRKRERERGRDLEENDCIRLWEKIIGVECDDYCENQLIVNESGTSSIISRSSHNHHRYLEDYDFCSVFCAETKSCEGWTRVTSVTRRDSRKRRKGAIIDTHTNISFQVRSLWDQEKYARIYVNFTIGVITDHIVSFYWSFQMSYWPFLFHPIHQ